jgi:hypothetical protein
MVVDFMSRNRGRRRSSVIIQKIYPRRRIARYMLFALKEAYDHKELPANLKT